MTMVEVKEALDQWRDGEAGTHQVDALAWAAARWLTAIGKGELVDLRLIAERLGVPLDTVNKWRYRQLLPPPDYPELRNPVWNWETIEVWARETGRL